jgi:hypothetical protein
MSGAIPPLLNTPSWRGAQFKKGKEQLYFTFIGTKSSDNNTTSEDEICLCIPSALCNTK